MNVTSTGMKEKEGLVVSTVGDRYWYKGGRYHREGGPAVEETDGFKKWYYHGINHRADGPAIIYPNGLSYWVVDDIFLDFDEVGIARGILSGEFFDKIPLYINHPKLKYFCQTALKGKDALQTNYESRGI